jgi:hypothetical protein
MGDVIEKNLVAMRELTIDFGVGVSSQVLRATGQGGRFFVSNVPSAASTLKSCSWSSVS